MTKVERYLDDAWAQLGELLAFMFGAFGGPAEVFLRRVLFPRDRQHILEWLGPLEAFARRLLAIEAAQLPAQNVPQLVPRPGRVGTLCRDAIERRESEAPGEWRVRFTLWPAGHPRGAAQGAGLSFTRRHVENAVPLAHRMEALLRVFRNRERYVQRMARLLAARRETAFEAFAPYRSRQRVGPADSLLNEAQAMLDEALTNTS